MSLILPQRGRLTVSVAGAITFTDQSSLSNSTNTVTLPASGVGDLAIHIQRSNNSPAASGESSSPTYTLPSGWTALWNTWFYASFNNSRFAAHCKVLESGDLGATVSAMSGQHSNHSFLVVVRPSSAITSLIIGTINQEATNGNPVSQTNDVSNATAGAICIAQYSSGGAVDPRTFTGGTSPSEINPNTFQYVKWNIQNSSWVDVSVDMDDEGSLNFIGSTWISAT